MTTAIKQIMDALASNKAQMADIADGIKEIRELLSLDNILERELNKKILPLSEVLESTTLAVRPDVEFTACITVGLEIY